MSGTHTVSRTAALSIAAASQFLPRLSPEQRSLANFDLTQTSGTTGTMSRRRDRASCWAICLIRNANRHWQ